MKRRRRNMPERKGMKQGKGWMGQRWRQIHGKGKGEWESFISGCRYREYKTQQRKKAKVPRREEKLEDITEGEGGIARGRGKEEARETQRRRRSDEEKRVGGREEAAGPGPEGLRALLWCCQHSGTRKRERAAAESREEGRGELISSTHAHGAALRVPRDSPGIPHNIPSSPLIPRRTHGACSPESPVPPAALFTSSAAAAWSQLYRPALQDFPASQRGVKIKTARCDYFTLIILHCVSCYYKSAMRKGHRIILFQLYLLFILCISSSFLDQDCISTSHTFLK